MKKVFSIEKYVEKMFDGDYEKAMKTFIVNENERDWVFSCSNKTIEDCRKIGYDIHPEWCGLYAENYFEKEILKFINKYGFTDYNIIHNRGNGDVFSIIFVDDGKISGEESYLIIRSRLYNVIGFEIGENSIILRDIEKIQKLFE